MEKLIGTIRIHLPLIVGLLFFLGIILPLKFSISVALLSIPALLRSRWSLILIIPLIGNLWMNLYIKTGKSIDGERIHVVVPSKGMAVIRGEGIFHSRLYPGEYIVNGTIIGDSLIVKRWERVRKTTPLAEWMDMYIRMHVLYPEDHFMARALFLGMRDKLLPEWKEWFRKSGNYHLLAISGLHTGIIFLIISLILSLPYIPGRWIFFIASIITGIYGWSIGFPPSVKRAFLFVFLFSIMRLLQRKTPALNILGLSMLITLILDPLEAFRAGFQLSYAATFGILYTFDYSSGSPVNRILLNPLKVAFSAQIFTTPLLLFHFSNAYPLFFPSSLITVPLTFLIMLNLIYALLLSPVIQLWASLHVMIKALLFVVKNVSSVPLPPLQIHINGRMAFSIIALETLLIFLIKRLLKKFPAKG